MADALSRMQGHGLLAITLSMEQDTLLDKIKESWKKDSHLYVVIQ